MHITIKPVKRKRNKGKSINLEVEDTSETIDLTMYGPTRQLILRLDPDPAPAPDAIFRIFVSTLLGKAFRLEVKGSETIEKVKDMVHEQGGPPVSEQTLLFHGTKLDNTSTLDDYNIKTDSNVFIMVHRCVC